MEALSVFKSDAAGLPGKAYGQAPFVEFLAGLEGTIVIQRKAHIGANQGLKPGPGPIQIVIAFGFQAVSGDAPLVTGIGAGQAQVLKAAKKGRFFSQQITITTSLSLSG